MYTPFSECTTCGNLTAKIINLCLRCYVSGRLDGTAKYYYTSGAIESRMYENGVLQVAENNCDDKYVGKTILSLKYQQQQKAQSLLKSLSYKLSSITNQFCLGDQTDTLERMMMMIR